jgi:ADP-sugar diphosphatase
MEKSTLIPNWLKKLDKEIKISELRIINFDLFPGPRIGFIEMDADYTWRGKNMNERFFLCGRSVYIVVLFVVENNDIYTVLVQQPRIGCGQMSLEFPAGMVDDSTDYRGTAIRELKEECGIEAIDDELVEISDFKYSFPAMCDDNAKVYVVQKRETLENLKKMENQCFGADEDEVITLKLYKLEDVEKAVSEGITLCVSMELNEKISTGELKIVV